MNTIQLYFAISFKMTLKDVIFHSQSPREHFLNALDLNHMCILLNEEQNTFCHCIFFLQDVELHNTQSGVLAVILAIIGNYWQLLGDKW